MKAITLHQPWASLVAVGAKQIETRSWRPPMSLLGERFAIHAGQKLISNPGSDFDKLVTKYLGDDWQAVIPRGAVVATAVLKSRYPMTSTNRLIWPDGDERSFGDYRVGRWMWNLADVIPLDPPKTARGFQRLWTWRIGDAQG